MTKKISTKRTIVSIVSAIATVLILGAAVVAQDGNPTPLINDPLVPTTVAPGSSAFTLTVNGTGFVAGSAVNWNGSQRPTTYISAAQLTAGIQASDIAKAQTASVTVTSPNGTASNVAFLTVTVPNLSIAFAGPSLQGYNSPRSVSAADLNGDGKTDLVVTDQGLDVVSIFLGNGDGSFQPRVDYAVGSVPDSVAIADFNGDGKADLVVADQNSDQISVLLGNGDGTFQSAVSYSAEHAPEWVVAGDFNGDGKLDVAVANYNGGPTVSILLGNGDGTFQPPIGYGSDLFVTGLAVGDFNGDGKLDLAVSVFPDGGVAGVLLGNGDGTFQDVANYPVQEGAEAIAVADVNGDGKLDLVVADEGDAGVSVLLGNGDGTFEVAANYATGTMPYAVVVADLNGDGVPDIATSDNNIGEISVLLGNGDGTFQSHVEYAVEPLSGSDALLSLAVGDFNGDGMLDIVSADAAYDLVSVLLQSTLSVSDTSLKFAAQTVGVSSSPQASTLSNVATKGSITVSSAQVSGANASDFAVKTTCAKLQPKSACKVNVTFKPTGSGTRTATVLITDSAVGSPHQITVTGTGAAPAVSLSATAMNFGTETVGTRSPIHSLNLTNSGNGTLTISGIAASGDFSESSNCGGKLNPGKSCKISVAFRPTKVGARAGKLTISDNAAGGSQSVALTGIGK